jgi:hypothetical protein
MYNDFEIYPLFTLLKTITLPWARVNLNYMTQMRVWCFGGGVGSWDPRKLMNPMFNAMTIHWIWIEHS